MSMHIIFMTIFLWLSIYTYIIYNYIYIYVYIDIRIAPQIFYRDTLRPEKDRVCHSVPCCFALLRFAASRAAGDRGLRYPFSCSLLAGAGLGIQRMWRRRGCTWTAASSKETSFNQCLRDPSSSFNHWRVQVRFRIYMTCLDSLSNKAMAGSISIRMCI